MNLWALDGAEFGLEVSVGARTLLGWNGAGPGEWRRFVAWAAETRADAP